MKIIKPSYKVLTFVDRIYILSEIEKIGRTCYKSEDKTTENSASDFVKKLIKNGHEAMIEHVSITVKFICDRGTSHEIVRHRIGSYAQESTRYCNYSNDKFDSEITVIQPCFDWSFEQNAAWVKACEFAESSYFALLALGAKPEEARSVLPNSLKTELVVTFNLRQWRAFLKLRTAKTAHPQMRELTIPLLSEFKWLLPDFFGDIGEIYEI